MSRDFLVDDQSEELVEAPRIIQPDQGQRSSSTVTSTCTSSGAENSQSMEQQMQQIQEMHQGDMEVDTSSSTVGSKNQQSQSNTQEFVGAPRMSSRQRRQPARYDDYMALVSQLVDSEPSSY